MEEDWGNMRLMRVLALLLIVVSALSFGLTINNILTTDWNVGWGFFDMGWGHGNWWEGTWSFSIWGGEHYNWFYGYYYESFELSQSLLDVLNGNPQPLTWSHYNPFPSALLGLYLLVCGIIFWFVKTENQRPAWFYNGNIRDNKFVAGALSLIGGGVLSLILSNLLVYGAHLRNDIYQAIYAKWVFPLAFLGIVLLTLGIVGLYFVIIENRRIPQFLEQQSQQS
jgi:hypothetical protein